MDPDVLVLRIERLNLPLEGSFRVKEAAPRGGRASWATRGVLALCLKSALLQDHQGLDGMLRVRRHLDRELDPLLISLEGRWVCPVGHIPIIA